MFFKIIILDEDAPAALDTLQQTYEIQDVQVLGFDSNNKYLLIKYATKVPA